MLSARCPGAAPASAHSSKKPKREPPQPSAKFLHSFSSSFSFTDSSRALSVYPRLSVHESKSFDSPAADTPEPSSGSIPGSPFRIARRAHSRVLDHHQTMQSLPANLPARILKTVRCCHTSLTAASPSPGPASLCPPASPAAAQSLRPLPPQLHPALLSRRTADQPSRSSALYN